jgi:hypothetical protein
MIPWSPSSPVQVSLLQEEVGKLTQVPAAPEPIQVDHVTMSQLNMFANVVDLPSGKP